MAKEAKDKKEYQTPDLVDYGLVLDLTQGSTGTIGDQGTGDGKRPKIKP